MLSILRAAIDSLTVSERRVAEICLQNPVAFASMPVGEIADRAYVSKPTVIRFCRNIGYLGLADFKRKLLTNSTAGTPYIHSKVGRFDNPEIISLKLVNNAIESLLSLRDKTNEDRVESAIRIIENVYKVDGRIQIFGLGYSSLIAQDLSYRLCSIGMRAVHLVDSQVQRNAALSLNSVDCAIVFSASGRTKEILDLVKSIRNRGIQVISVTLANSPLSRLVNVNLEANHDEAPDEFNPTVSRLLQLMISDILVTTAALAIDCKNFQKRLETVQCNLKNRRLY